MAIEAGVVTVRVVPNTTGFSSALGKGMSSAGKSLQSAGRTLTTHLSLPLIAAGAVATKMALTFDQTFTKIQALADAGGQSIDQMKTSVLGLAGQTAQAPQDLAEGLYFVASAGLKAADQMPVLEASARAAASGMGDVQTIAQTLTSVMNAYASSGLTATSASDTLTQAIRIGKAEPQEWAQSLGTVIPAAAQAGVSFSDLAAALATATDVGVPFAEAVTGARFLLNNLRDATPEATDALNKMGLTAGDLNKSLDQRGLTGTMQMLASKLDLTSVKGAKAWSAIVGGARGAKVANTLVGDSAELASRNVDKMANSTGQAARAFRKMSKTDAFKFQQALTDLKVAAIKLGNTLIPILTHQIIPAIERLVKWWGSLGDEGRATAVKIGILAAALGPALGLAGALLRVGGGVVSAISWISKLGSAAKAAAGPTGKLAGQMLMFGGGAAEAPMAAAGPVLALAAIIGTDLVVAYVKARMEASRFSQGLTDGSVKASEVTARIGDQITAVKQQMESGSHVGESWLSRLGDTAAGVLGPVGRLVGVGRELIGVYSNIGALKDYAKGLNDAADAAGLAQGSFRNWALQLQVNSTMSVDAAKKFDGLVHTLVGMDALTPKLKFEVKNLVNAGDIKGAIKLLQDQLDKVTFKPKVDAKNANRDIGKLKSGVAHPPPKMNVDTSGAKKKVDDLGKHVSDVGKKHPAKVDADTAPANKKIADTGKKITDLGKKHTKPKVDADTSPADKKIAGTDKGLGALAKKHTKPVVDADNSRAMSAIGTVARALANLHDKTITITANVVKKGAVGLLAGTGMKQGGIAVPALANGAQITHGPTLALIGEAGPEAVVPLTRRGVFHGPPIHGLGPAGPVEISGELSISEDGTRAFVEGVLVDNEAFAARGQRARR